MLSFRSSDNTDGRRNASDFDILVFDLWALNLHYNSMERLARAVNQPIGWGARMILPDPKNENSNRKAQSTKDQKTITKVQTLISNK